jgi:hypothetical protein
MWTEKVIDMTCKDHQMDIFDKCTYHYCGSTLNEVLRTLRILNEDNDIRIFSLIGRKDLMADSY